MSPKEQSVSVEELLTGIIVVIAASTIIEVKIYHIFLCGREAFALREISVSHTKQIYRLLRNLLRQAMDNSDFFFQQESSSLLSITTMVHKTPFDDCIIR